MSVHNTSRLPQSREKRPFLKALFDPDFSEWITLRIAGYLFVLSNILISGAAIWFFFDQMLFSAELFTIQRDLTESLGFLWRLAVTLLASLLAWFLVVVLNRLIYEVSIAIVTIAQNSEDVLAAAIEIAKNGKSPEQ